MDIELEQIRSARRLRCSQPGGVLFRPTADGIAIEHYPLPDGEKLGALQAGVGGPIECVPLGKSRHRQFVEYDGWVNEEGNIVGARIAMSARSDHGGHHCVMPFAGPMLVTAAESVSGATIPLIPEEIHDLALLELAGADRPVVTLAPEMKDA